MSIPSIQHSPTTLGHTLTSSPSSQQPPPSNKKRSLFQSSPTNTRASSSDRWESDESSPTSSPKKTPPPFRTRLFGSPSDVASAPLAGDTSSASTKRARKLDEFSLFDQNENTSSTINLPKTAQTAAKIETSFRAFLASFPATATTTTTSYSSKMPPPMKRGVEARLSVQERLARLERSYSPEKLSFLRAAANAAATMDPNYQKLGEGSFSNVYLLPPNGNGASIVKKVFKEHCVTGGNAKALQGTPLLYALAKASEDQFQQIRNAYTRNEFPVDVLEILNLSTWRQDGFFTQPRVTNMFKPLWDTFAAKVTLHGSGAQITDEEEALLLNIQSVFQKALQLNLCIDFKPENLGCITVQGQQRIVIIDTFGLSGSESDDIASMTRFNINEFANGNSAIKAFLSQVVDR